MNFFTRAVDRFCSRHPRFGISNLMLFIIIGNAICFLFTMMDTTGTFVNALYFSAPHILRGQIWRLITFVFVPEQFNILYLFLSLYFYYFIGSALEREWGSAKFTIFYISGVLFNILLGFIVYFAGGLMYVGTAYLNLSMFFAFAAFYPDHMVLLFFFIPIKIKWLAYLDAVYFVYSMLVAGFPGCLLPPVAILNFLLFCGNMVFSGLSLSKLQRKRKQRAKVVQFRSEARTAQREAESKPYRHKCAVCGKTDTDYPELEFRYCSKCAGYHCFCIDHINNHVHFTE